MRFIWAAIFMLGLSVQGAQAQTMKPFMGLVFPENTTEESRAIIQRCWDIELENKTGVDDFARRDSFSSTRACLREEITKAWYELVNIEQRTIDDLMHPTSFGVRQMAAHSFFGYKGCKETDCDFPFPGIVHYEVIRVYQRMIANLYWQKEAYKEQ